MTVSKSDGFPSLVTYNQDHLRRIGLPLGGIVRPIQPLGKRDLVRDTQ